MTTYTTLARLPQMTPFDPALRLAWGPPVNAAWAAVEQLAAGNGAIDLTGLSTYAVTVANDASDQARQAMLNFTGTSATGGCTVTIPPVSRIGWITNSTPNQIILTAGGTTNLTVAAGQAILYTVTSNAVTAVPIGYANNLNVAGNLAVTGTVTASGDVHANCTGAFTVKGGAATALFANLSATTSCTQVYGGSGGLKIYNSAFALQVTIPPTGAVVFAETVNAVSFVTTSDGRAKSNIEDITTDDAYRWVRAGRARNYTISGRRRAGFIAQEDIASGRGDAVYKMRDDRDLYAKGDGFAPDGHRLARDYEYDCAYLTRALAAALDRIDALEAAALSNGV